MYIEFLKNVVMCVSTHIFEHMKIEVKVRIGECSPFLFDRFSIDSINFKR